MPNNLDLATDSALGWIAAVGVAFIVLLFAYSQWQKLRMRRLRRRK